MSWCADSDQLVCTGAQRTATISQRYFLPDGRWLVLRVGFHLPESEHRKLEGRSEWLRRGVFREPSAAGGLDGDLAEVHAYIAEPTGASRRLGESGWRRQGCLGQIETVGHPVGRRAAGVQCGQAERSFTEFDQAHVRVERLGDIALACIRAQHQATNAPPVSELGAICPLLDLSGGHVIPPAAPVIPRDE